MQAIICGPTALDYWRSCSSPLGGVEQIWEYAPARKGPVQLDTPSAAIVADVASIVNADSDNVHLLVTSKSMNRDIKAARFTTCVGPFPTGSFARVHQQVYAAVPEFTFLLLARTLSLVELLEVGYELCGTYRIIDGQPEYGCQPLTSVSRLRAFANRASGIRGYSTALQACQWLLDGSGSPAETALSIAFKLPYRKGGYGLRGFVLNYELELNDSASYILGRRTMRPDLFFVQARHPVEYDGPMFHSGRDSMARDERRRNAYSAMNMAVSVFQPRHLTDFTLFDEMIRAIRTQTGQRQNRVPARYELDKYVLLSEVFRFWNKP